MPAKTPPFIRLFKKVVKQPSGCWEWTGSLNHAGYGQIKAFGTMVGCHRLSYQLYNGDIPEGKEVMHICDNPKCINPDHLRVGTHAENMADMDQKGRRVLGKQNPRRGDANRQSKPVVVLGKRYGSMNEAERALGLGSGTVRYWILYHPLKAQLANH